MSVATPDQPHGRLRVTKEATLSVRFCSDDCGTPIRCTTGPIPTRSSMARATWWSVTSTARARTRSWRGSRARGRDIVSNSGTVIDHIAYDAYGNVISESDASDGDQFKFDGMAWDAAIGLYYDNARYYNPANGRFVSQDSIEFRGNDANLYRYTSNDPADNIDTNGEKKSRISIGNITSTDPGLLGVVTLTTPYTTIQGEITWPYTDYTPTTVTTTITGPTSATYTRWRFGRSPSNLDQNFFNPTLWTYYNTFPILFDPGSTVTFTTTVTGTYTGDPANGVNKPASVQITSEPKTVKF
jgi:RHS repeat-associated protein